MGTSFKQQRAKRTKVQPQSPAQIALSSLIAGAMGLGRLQILGKQGRLSWAAFYTEKGKFDLERVQFEVQFNLVGRRNDHATSQEAKPKPQSPQEPCQACLKKGQLVRRVLLHTCAGSQGSS